MLGKFETFSLEFMAYPESLTCYAGGAQLGICQCLLWLHHMYTCHSVIVCRNDCMACPESLACYAIQMNVKM